MSDVLKFASRPADCQSPDRLTPRECEVISIAYLRNKEIAYRLGISEQTVKAHLKNLRLKLGADSKAHAVMLWAGGRAA